jgi:hypothetical protein
VRVLSNNPSNKKRHPFLSTAVDSPVKVELDLTDSREASSFRTPSSIPVTAARTDMPSVTNSIDTILYTTTIDKLIHL